MVLGREYKDVGTPGYFAANDWFRWLPNPDFGGEPGLSREQLLRNRIKNGNVIGPLASWGTLRRACTWSIRGGGTLLLIHHWPLTCFPTTFSPAKLIFGTTLRA